MSDREHFTLVFEGDLTRFPSNPYKAETPFGKPVKVGFGDAFDYQDDAEAKLARALEGLKAIIDRSNNDPLGTSKVADMRKLAERTLSELENK